MGLEIITGGKCESEDALEPEPPSTKKKPRDIERQKMVSSLEEMIEQLSELHEQLSRA